MADLHPGHDQALVAGIVDEWRDEFGIEDAADHVEIGSPPNSEDACEINSLTNTGNVLLERLIKAGVLSVVQ